MDRPRGHSYVRLPADHFKCPSGLHSRAPPRSSPVPLLLPFESKLHPVSTDGSVVHHGGTMRSFMEVCDACSSCPRRARVLFLPVMLPLRNDYHFCLLHLHILLILRKIHWDRHVSKSAACCVPKKTRSEDCFRVRFPTIYPRRGRGVRKTHPKPQPFDRVTVSTHDGTMAVDVREKFTLSRLELHKRHKRQGPECHRRSRGIQSGRDRHADRRSVQLQPARTECGMSDLRTRVPTGPLGERGEGSYASNGIRFADSTAAWTRNRIGGEFELKGPFGYGSLRYEVVAKIYRELVQDGTGTGPRPPDGYYVGLIPEVTWDRYHWHDLLPSRVSHRAGTSDLGTSSEQTSPVTRYGLLPSGIP